MKSRFLGVGLGSSIFIFLTIAVLALVRPVYVRMSDELSAVEKNVVKILEEKTGLSVSFKSLSPSVFASANIKKIEIKDVESGITLLSIKKAVLSYSISEFFSKNPVLALKTLTLNGVSIEYDAMKEFSFIEKLKLLKNFSDEASSETKISVQEDSEQKAAIINLQDKTFDFPFDVIVKNLSVHYSDAHNDVIVALKNLNLNDFDRADGVSIKTSGNAHAYSDFIPGTKKRGSVAFGFSVSGKFFPDFNGSSALVSLSGIGGADYSISHLDMLVNYDNNRVEVRTMRTVLPFSVYAHADLKQGAFGVQAEFDRFDPFRLVSIRKKTDMLKKLSNSLLSGSLSADMKGSKVDYRTNLRIALSQRIVGSPIELSLVLNGNMDYVNITKVSAKGEIVDADFSGGFNIKKLQPSGVLSLNFLKLSNNGIISTELYIDPSRNGFMCFAPQFFLNDKAFTALQFSAYPANSSLDFAFEFFDYSHSDYESSGHFSLDGSLLLGKEKFLQASLSVSDFFVDSLVDTAAFFSDENTKALLSGVSKTAEPYVFNTEAYVSSDFKDFSINAPACLLANSRKDRELLIFAADGSSQTFNISQFDLQFGSLEAHATSSVDFADSLREFSFISDLTVNSVPYRFSGNVTPTWISVSGDYDFDAIISLGDVISGNIGCRKFPVSVGKNVFALTYDTSFSWNRFDGISAEILSFELDEPSGNLSFSPYIAFSGSANRYGFMFNTFAYADNVSSLDGSGSILWNLNENVFDSIHISLNGSSVITSENIIFEADFTNPAQLPFSAEALMNEFYMSVSASVYNFPVARLLGSQTKANTISADLTASGTIANPFVSMNLHRSSIQLYGYPLEVSASLVYDDTGLNLNDMNCSWSVARLRHFNASFDPQNFTGEAGAEISLLLDSKTINVPFKLSMHGEAPQKKFSVPDFFSIELNAAEVGGNFFADPFPLKLTAVHTPNRFDIFSENGGLRASIENGEKVSCHADGRIAKFDMDGIIRQDNLDLEVKGIYADFRKIASQVELPVVKFNSGILKGALKISGMTTDPEITGAFNAERVNLMIPFISPSAFVADKIFMTVGQGEAKINPTQVFLGKGWGMVGMQMEFNRWRIDEINISVDVDGAHKVPIELALPFVHINGDGSCQLNIEYTNPSLIEVKGWIVGENTDVEFVTSVLQTQFSLEDLSESIPVKSDPEEDSLNIIADLDITVGQKVQILFNPLLRGVVAPGTPISVYVDTDSGDFEFKSDVVLRGGEIVWLNRNFYMKEGRIEINENQDRVDPKITVRAETRERDENGNMVTIVLSAQNEPLSTFNPKFSATPAKSEKEIMELLGQFVSADSENIASLAVAGGDYLMQATVMRRLENTLREMLNFDIFSIRTNVLQNSLKFTMNRNETNKQLSIGNFIDNSTVYVGKYFGSSMYVDTLLHWSYDEDKAEDGSSVNAIVFQPEFGFEMSSPFVNIRLGIAPDIEALRKGDQGMWVPATSLTLSWKHSF